MYEVSSDISQVTRERRKPRKITQRVLGNDVHRTNSLAFAGERTCGRRHKAHHAPFLYQGAGNSKAHELPPRQIARRHDLHDCRLLHLLPVVTGMRQTATMSWARSNLPFTITWLDVSMSSYGTVAKARVARFLSTDGIL